MRKLQVALLAALFLASLPIGEDRVGATMTAIAKGSERLLGEGDRPSVLSHIWGASIHQWSPQIEKEARANGLDPDLIASVIDAESNGNQDAVSWAGAVGLMGVMPTGPGLEWRPSTESLKDPDVNVNWGVAILAKIIQQSGGDIVAALAAYSGGWDQANSRVPQRYASQVLNNYGRAVAVRSNVSPDIASEWTIATEITRGHIPVDRLILSERPLSGLRKYGEHIVFNYTDDEGRAYYVKGFAVPLALVVPIESTAETLDSDIVDTQLMARLGMADTKISGSNSRILLACLPSLGRLRGQLATRWYHPSDCPGWHR